jgi:hypothetical protein
VGAGNLRCGVRASVIGGRSQFDERAHLVAGVPALDDDEGSARDPGLQQGVDLRLVRSVRRIEVQDPASVPLGNGSGGGVDDQKVMILILASPFSPKICTRRGLSG